MNLSPERKWYLFAQLFRIYATMIVELSTGNPNLKKKRYLAQVKEANLTQDKEEGAWVEVMAERLFQAIQQPGRVSEDWFGEKWWL